MGPMNFSDEHTRGRSCEEEVTTRLRESHPNLPQAYKLTIARQSLIDGPEKGSFGSFWIPLRAGTAQLEMQAQTLTRDLAISCRKGG